METGTKIAIGAGVGYLVFRNLRGMFTIVFLIILLCFFFSPDEPTVADKRAEIRQVRNEDIAKPNRLIISFKEAIVDRNIPEIDRLYRAVVHSIESAVRTQEHLVARDVDIMLGILQTCPVEIKNEQWGIDSMSHSLSRAQVVELLRRESEIDRLEAVRAGKIDPNWRPPNWRPFLLENRNSP